MRGKLIILMCVATILFSFAAFAANQNITQENITTSLSIYDAPAIGTVTIEDSDSGTPNLVDPVPADYVEVNCTADVSDEDTDADLNSAWSELYLQSVGYGAGDDSVNHYTNSACDIDTAYGTANQAFITCTYNLTFYVAPGTWECNITVNDSQNLQDYGMDTSVVTELLALDVEDGNIDFGSLAIGQNTTNTDYAKVINNSGNVNLTMNLNVWGAVFADTNAMNCSSGTLPDSDIKVGLVSAEAYGSKQAITADGSIGSAVTGFYINPQNDGSLTPTTGSLYFGLGVSAGGSPVGNCEGNLMFTAGQGA